MRPPTSGPEAARQIAAILALYRIRQVPACTLAGLAPSTLWRWKCRDQVPTRERWLLLLRAALELAAEAGALTDQHADALTELRREVTLPAPRTLEDRVERLERTVARLELRA